MTQLRIMIASDLSESSLSTVEEGIKLSKKLDAIACIVNVVDNTSQYSSLQYAGIAGFTAFENWEKIQQYALELLTEKTREFGDVKKEIVVKIGDPKKEIIELTKHLNVSYLVIGTHGRTGLSHLVAGSNAEYLIRHTTIPVVVIPYRRETH